MVLPRTGPGQRRPCQSFTHSHHLIGGLGFTEEITLCLGAISHGQACQLIICLDPLGRCDHSQLFAKIGDRVDDRVAVSALPHARDERLVDFDLAEGKPPQIAE